MHDKREDGSDGGHVGGRFDETQLAVLVKGVFWFTWLTGKYRRAALFARQLEGQRAERN